MSGKVVGAAFDCKIEPTAKFVFVAMAENADHDGNNVYPSIELMVWKTGLSERTVRACIRRLEAMGLIVRVDSNRAGGRGHRAEYRIPIDDLPVRTRPRKGAPIAGFMADQETGKRVQDVQGLSGERVQDVQGLEKERVQMATVKGADERTKKEGHLLKEPSIEPYKETTLSGSKEKRARAMSESWTLSPDDREWARVEHGLSDAEISEQADRFRDHFLANGKPLKNWSAAWHNWIRRAPEFSNGRGKSRTEERAGHPAAFDIEAYRDRSRGLR